MAHEYREANQVVDRLANLVVKNNETKRWTDKQGMPPKILDLIESDLIMGRLGNIKF